MRPSLLVFAAACFACTPQGLPRLPPADSFHFPAGLAHVDDPSSPGADGYLYVAGSNFDRRFDFGAVTAVDLASVGLPAFGDPVPAGGPPDLRELHLGPQSQVLTESFAGEMAKFPLPDGSTRLFIPSRAENSYVYMLDARQGTIGCQDPRPVEDIPDAPPDCSTSAPSQSLTVNERASPTGKPRAPGPIGVGVSADGEVFVTHFRGADSPVGSATNIEAYVVRFDAQAPAITDGSYISVGPGGTQSVAVGERYAFVTGRYSLQGSYILRLVDRTGKMPVLQSALEQIFAVRESRGIALSVDGSDPNKNRLYVVARDPDTLLVVDVQGALTDYPTLALIRAVPLPAGANEIELIERAGRGALAVITCSSAGMVVLYDDDAGQLVAELSGVGVQPFGLDVQLRGAGARIFAGLFGDGRIAVLDLPDLLQPQDLRLVARMGTPQECLVPSDNPACAEAAP